VEMAAAFTSYTSLREEAYKKYKTKRLQEGFIFLKTITFDGDYDQDEEDVFIDDSLVEECASPLESFENEPSLCSLINSKESTKTRLTSSAAANFSLIDDEIRHIQKVHFDNVENDLTSCRSKSTFLNLKEVAKQLIQISSPSVTKQTNTQLAGKRVILVTPQHVPFQLFSIVPYRRVHVIDPRRASINSNALTSTSAPVDTYIDDVDLGDGKREVSYKHLLNPVIWSRKRIGSETDADTQHETSDYSMHNEVEHVLLDNPEFTCGKHRTVLTLPTYTVSIIQYAKPAKVKKDINERFKEKFPAVTITLTKLRSIKAEMLTIGQKMLLDVAIIACAFVYFEKTVLKTRITKHNRKYIAGACLLLSIKFSDDFESKNIKSCIEAITDQFRLSHKDLLCCELQVLILMEFSLMMSIGEVLPIVKRLEGTLPTPPVIMQLL